MTELKLGDLKGLLPEFTNINQFHAGEECERAYADGRNTLLSGLHAKNLLDYVEAVKCEHCKGKGFYARNQESLYLDLIVENCEYCNATGAVIRVKEVCPTCHGKKTLLTADPVWGWDKADNKICFVCKGTGKLSEQRRTK